MTPRAPSDLAGLRSLSVETLGALQAGHSPGTVRANGRADGGRSRGPRDTQSSALPVKRLYTLKEAARYLGVGYWRVRGYVDRGVLPKVQLPGTKRWHVTVDDLEQLVSAHREATR